MLKFLQKCLKKIEKWIEKLREISAERGYTCDGCGKEIFDYPQNRLCEDCKTSLYRPKRICPKCGRETRANGVCLECKKVAPSFTKGISPFAYRGEVASLVNRLKNGDPRLAYFFGEEMAKAFATKYPLPQKGSQPLLIVPVPLSKPRLRARGYNQAGELALSVGKTLTRLGYKVEVNKEILIKKRDTALQKQMNFQDRTENVSGVFHVKSRKAFRGRTVLLIDDIMTTGATGDTCAKRIFGAGAKSVFFLVATALPGRK